MKITFNPLHIIENAEMHVDGEIMYLEDAHRPVPKKLTDAAGKLARIFTYLHNQTKVTQ